MSIDVTSGRVTRLAPSPTGALHLGNARTFLLTWLLARSRCWRIALRIEDLDGPRVKAGADLAAIDDLCWLGLDWDGGPTYQSTRQAVYACSLTALLAAGLAYPCTCTRAEVERAASAPHADDGSAVYPGTCRDRYASVDVARRASGREPAIRFRVDDDRIIRWHDGFAGEQSIPLKALGDFVIAKADGTAGYQLAVVVDDAAAGVTDVVRGDDLLDSTPRQIALYNALNLGRPPTYYHLPLVVGPDGRRLAKRHGDTRLSSYRAVYDSPDRVLALLARWSGMTIERLPASATDLLSAFDLARVSAANIVLNEKDIATLTSETR
jgi:glutamyl-tRNA synthetase